MEPDTHNQPNHPNREHKCCEKDGFSRIFTGLIVIWLGVTLYLNNMGWFESGWWAYFVLGIGILLLAEAVIRLSKARQHPSVSGKLIGGSVLVALGASNIYNLQDWWPLIFVAVGLAIIFINVQQNQHQEEGVDQ